MKLLSLAWILKKMYIKNPKIYICVLYFFNTKKVLNLNKLVTYNEKIQWLKLNSMDDLVIKCADKYSMRDYVKSKKLGNYLTKIYGAYTNESEIEYDKLPSTCMMKLSSGWNNNIIWHEWYGQKQKDEINNMFKKWRRESFGYYTGETQYFNLFPRIICEEYLGEDLYDYKFLCFHGKVELIQVDIERWSEHKRDFYDCNWNRKDVQYGYPNSKTGIKRPEKIKEMIHIAEVLSKDFIHVRIDLYFIDGQIRIGEMTFTPTAGYKDFYPDKINYWLGEKICI